MKLIKVINYSIMISNINYVTISSQICQFLVPFIVCKMYTNIVLHSI